MPNRRTNRLAYLQDVSTKVTANPTTYGLNAGHQVLLPLWTLPLGVIRLALAPRILGRGFRVRGRVRARMFLGGMPGGHFLDVARLGRPWGKGRTRHDDLFGTGDADFGPCHAFRRLDLPDRLHCRLDDRRPG